MKPAQFREMSDEHLQLTLNETVKHLFQLRFQSATERLETPSEIRKAKQDIARVLTLQRERQLVRELLAQLPEEQVKGIQGLPEQHQLAAARAAARQASGGGAGQAGEEGEITDG
ncbi:MAG: 50S ribosomal protein L29 [Planctomycetes bacterium]|nr:50S ribosomal protein L29 [Planctomycetota bacterium]